MEIADAAMRRNAIVPALSVFLLQRHVEGQQEPLQRSNHHALSFLLGCARKASFVTGRQGHDTR